MLALLNISQREDSIAKFFYANITPKNIKNIKFK